MKKSTIRWWILWAVLLTVYSVTAFALPFLKTPVYWLSYLFSLLAIIAQIYVIHTAFPQGSKIKSKFYGFPIARIGLLYLIAQIALSFLFMSLSTTVPIWVPLIIYVLLIGIAIVGLIAADSAREEVECQDIIQTKNVSTIRMLQAKGNSFKALTDNESLKKEFSIFAEQLQYSDPVSNDSVLELELHLTNYMNEIEAALTAGDFESALSLVKKAQSILAQRNTLCKLSKN